MNSHEPLFLIDWSGEKKCSRLYRRCHTYDIRAYVRTCVYDTNYKTDGC